MRETQAVESHGVWEVRRLQVSAVAIDSPTISRCPVYCSVPVGRYLFFAIRKWGWGRKSGELRAVPFP
ncbi:MAG: hypothetical protein QFX35_06965 [Candidatus Verstraetearchaeota archaeon]|nr:hypothetical protein [Candidatus Verstraetearchaeota archaeon]